MSATHGFELIREHDVPEINSRARLYRHAATGAELLSLVNSDENKVFGISFATPPSDSTGVAHILEHSVLCGSRKYPVKEPFVELMKSSLSTFLNAMTYPDKTVYPVASQNVHDFYNLIEVYLDAVFFPRLTRHIFEQEGWHYELDAPDAPLAYKGVVFNEMKGNYSSPDTVLRELSQESLYPDITYGLDSGGDPKHIPDLTYEQLKAFHQRHYHPSNAKLFFYGDDDPDERLRRVGAHLDEFSRIAVDAGVPLQPRFTAPKRLERTYAAGEANGGEPAQETMLTVNWMLDEASDVEAALAMTILHEILVGTPAAPLYKALIDSGLGHALTGGGLETDLRQPMFSIGLKGIDAAAADKIERLIDDTLGSLAKDGIDPLTVEAALNTVEFALRENNTGSFPRGIAFMLRALRPWLHGRDPIGELAKSVLDGHITLSRELAGRGHYPAIDVLNSISRVAQRICSPEQNAARRRFVELYARWRDAEELIALGTYHAGGDRRTDEAVALHEKLEAFLKQDVGETVSLQTSALQLAEAIA